MAQGKLRDVLVCFGIVSVAMLSLFPKTDPDFSDFERVSFTAVGTVVLYGAVGTVVAWAKRVMDRL